MCRGNACMYERSLISVACGVGRAYMPGLERPELRLGTLSFGSPDMCVPLFRVSVPFPVFLLVCGYDPFQY